MRKCLILCVFLCGCGTGFDPLQSNENLRTACTGENGVLPSDDYLEAALLEIHGNMENGFSAADVQAAEFNACVSSCLATGQEPAICYQDCGECIGALVRQVYGI